MLGMRKDALDDLLRPALVAQDRRAVLRVLVEGRVHLVVEVVQERGRPPELLVLAEPDRVGADCGLHGESVAQQRLALRVPRQGLPGALASRLQSGARIAVRMAQALIRDSLAESFVLQGGQALSGRVTASGNKNGALPILAACLLTSEPVVLHNVPRIRDVETMRALIAQLGGDVDWIGENEVRVHAADVSSHELDA